MLYLVDEEEFYFTSDNGKHVLYFAASFMPAISNYHGLFHEGFSKIISKNPNIFLPYRVIKSSPINSEN